MNWIVAKKNLWNNVVKLEIKAPEIASNWLPGQYVNIKVSEDSEKLPITISSVDKYKGTISLYVHKIGAKSNKLANLNLGGEVFSLDGACGEPIEIAKYGTVLCAAGAVGIAPIFPVIKALYEAGNRIIVVIAAKNNDYVILEKELRMVSERLIIMTDDGSCGNKGYLVQGMQEVLRQEKIDKVIAIGSALMVKYSSLLAKKYNIDNTAILYSKRVSRLGIHGIYRVTSCGGAKSVCVDGPDFNAYYSDMDEMVERLGCNKEEEFEGNQNYLPESNQNKLEYLVV